ncbi:TlpA family protein disulfide reductase [Zobellia amurskyensis]|uniref:TlpA family protein disulfide reductase n=1 Tax=Zobellia amurskyensis TaxID=248905 RepID=A0A7X2ZQE5_9FLAO|nr:TlpA disulfide reductase family protein [Zobellia amurskyensis]MUH34479.1 TlpA family protein disulfide reductase [Zobellia amurskyensis]
MKKRKFNISDGLLLVFVLLLIIPQTRKPIQVALNSLKMQFFSPSALSEEDQRTLEPFDYHVATLDGVNTSLEIGKNKVTFISYWATWCPPCIAEMPSIQKLYNDYGGSVNFVLLTNEEPSVVKQFLDKKQYSLPVYIPKIKAPDPLYERSIPTNFVIDKDGIIIVKETGSTDWNAQKFRKILDNLIAM